MVVLKLLHLDQLWIVNYEPVFQKCPVKVFFTLHMTAMSAPIFKSPDKEILAGSRSQLWNNLELSHNIDEPLKLAQGVIVRIWESESKPSSTLLFSWGVHFAALHRIGKSNILPKYFAKNTLIFGLKGGLYTSSDSCLIQDPAPPIEGSASIHSYSKYNLLRLRALQRTIVKQKALTDQQKSLVENWDLRPPKRDQLIYRTGRHFLGLVESNPRNYIEDRKTRRNLLKKIEGLEMRVEILRKQKKLMEENVNVLQKNCVDEKVSVEKMRNFYTRKRITLDKESLVIEDLWVRCENLQEELTSERYWLGIRRRQLISDLCQVYPITHDDKSSYIHGLSLPHAEYMGHYDDVKLSVALGYVAHVVYMTSYFLNVPLRHPITCKDSRSTVTDQLREGSLKNKEAKFTLFVKGRDRQLFQYGVYLLNRNISQLRHYLGLKTKDLGAILPNLDEVLMLRFSSLGNWHNASIDTRRPSSQESESICGYKVPRPFPLGGPHSTASESSLISNVGRPGSYSRLSLDSRRHSPSSSIAGDRLSIGPRSISGRENSLDSMHQSFEKSYEPAIGNFSKSKVEYMSSPKENAIGIQPDINKSSLKSNTSAFGSSSHLPLESFRYSPSSFEVGDKVSTEINSNNGRESSVDLNLEELNSHLSTEQGISTLTLDDKGINSTKETTTIIYDITSDLSTEQGTSTPNLHDKDINSNKETTTIICNTTSDQHHSTSSINHPGDSNLEHLHDPSFGHLLPSFSSQGSDHSNLRDINKDIINQEAETGNGVKVGLSSPGLLVQKDLDTKLVNGVISFFGEQVGSDLDDVKTKSRLFYLDNTDNVGSEKVSFEYLSNSASLLNSSIERCNDSAVASTNEDLRNFCKSVENSIDTNFLKRELSLDLTPELSVPANENENNVRCIFDLQKHRGKNNSRVPVTEKKVCGRTDCSLNLFSTDGQDCNFSKKEDISDGDSLKNCRIRPDNQVVISTTDSFPSYYDEKTHSRGTKKESTPELVRILPSENVQGVNMGINQNDCDKNKSLPCKVATNLPQFDSPRLVPSINIEPLSDDSKNVTDDKLQDVQLMNDSQLNQVILKECNELEESFSDMNTRVEALASSFGARFGFGSS
ncbi:uncharacterized protein LOC136036955 [Artemia franciscana]|uniref:UV radiation resistance-associated gene protein n=1 Tax=Artemia franciscana TaxID=6661 RepID=A0AA88L5T0_ARTSF|nr:hypothetical protein QYM36_005173 [Artemia franciscana]